MRTRKPLRASHGRADLRSQATCDIANASQRLRRSDHRGFRRDILAYDLSSAKWSSIGETPFALVTTPVIEWNGRIVIPGGEARPGIRSAEVWSASRMQQ